VIHLKHIKTLQTDRKSTITELKNAPQYQRFLFFSVFSAGGLKSVTATPTGLHEKR